MLSGGYGTLEELLEVITWAQLGIHEKPVRSHKSNSWGVKILQFWAKPKSTLHQKTTKKERNLMEKYSRSKIKNKVCLDAGGIVKRRWILQFTPVFHRQSSR